MGQHIVRLIEERDPTVKEIRIVDLRKYENRLSKYHENGKEIQELRGGKENHFETREKLISNLNFSYLISLEMFLFHLEDVTTRKELSYLHSPSPASLPLFPLHNDYIIC